MIKNKRVEMSRLVLTFFGHQRARADQLFIVINMLDFDMEMSKSRGIPQKRVKCPSASNRSIFFIKSRAAASGHAIT